MGKKIITISIIGVGGRGAEAYGSYVHQLKDKFKISALCDPNLIRLEKYGTLFEIPEENRFASEEAFFKEKRSDVAIIATMDRLHVRQALKALELGYDLLLEKPISDNIEELRELSKAARKSESIILVCHVLRYTAMVKKIKELLDNGSIGQLISIDHTENIVFWHQAHSYVRGNWRNHDVAVPEIMAKCCHDLDLLQYFAGSECESLSSIGDNRYFRRENMPKGATTHCLECPYRGKCVYDAQTIYMNLWKAYGCAANVWPISAITDVIPQTKEAISEALKGDYGRCVYQCDNDMVDNQTVIMRFANGITATLKMEAFVKYGGRSIRFFGSEGELDCYEDEDRLVLKPFGKQDQTWKISELDPAKDKGGHGNGDHNIINTLYEMIVSKNKAPETALDKSLESHYMALAAEESRIKGGELIKLENYRLPKKINEK